MKRFVGAIYGILAEPVLDKVNNWKAWIEKDYLNYCRTGCSNCYKWNGDCRSEKDGTPYKKFRKKQYKRRK